MFGLKSAGVLHSLPPQKHSQIKSPYESKPSLHPTEPQYCRRILLILPSPPFRNSILYPITCPPCLEQQNILRFCEKKSGALCLVLRGSSYIKRLQALGVWALVHSPTHESKSAPAAARLVYSAIQQEVDRY